jgi:hypothetical protein
VSRLQRRRELWAALVLSALKKPLPVILANARERERLTCCDERIAKRQLDLCVNHVFVLVAQLALRESLIAR